MKSINKIIVAVILSAGLGGLCIAQNLTDFERAVVQGFIETCDGWSSDEVLLEDARRNRFLETVREQVAGADEGKACLTLIKLRKAGKLAVKATRRGKPVDSSVLPTAEIAARTVMEKYDVSTDTIIAVPKYRNAFDQAVRQVDIDVSLYAARKAALQLRKSRRLMPELVLRVADWDKEVRVMPIAEVRADLESVPTLPGVYLFRDATGYIYVGEAANLRTRLTQHLTGSDRKQLATYIESQAGRGLSIEWHAFPKDSPARLVAVRRAYESELIRSRKPRLNVRP